MANVPFMFYSLHMETGRKNIRPELKTPGRAAGSNEVGRFEPHTRAVVDDGWDIPEDEIPVRTEISLERPRRVITRNDSPDLPFDRSVNPYRGCEHGCIYCFARPSHAYLGLSPGLDFETHLIARPLLPEVLRQELSAPRYACAPIAIGSNTDAYQPCENELGIMRETLKVLQEFNHPVAIVTKGCLIERDLDILGDMARRNLVQVGVSVATLDRGLARKLEPRVPTPERRLETIRRLSDAGCPVRLMVAPIIPGLTDDGLEAVLAAGAAAGAKRAAWTILRLPREVSPLFQDWLQRHVPDRAGRVMARVRDTHGGKDYDAQWGVRMRGQGVYADLIAKRFSVAAKRAGYQHGFAKLRTDLFQVPGRAQQLSLF